MLELKVDYVFILQRQRQEKVCHGYPQTGVLKSTVLFCSYFVFWEKIKSKRLFALEGAFSSPTSKTCWEKRHFLGLQFAHRICQLGFQKCTARCLEICMIQYSTYIFFWCQFLLREQLFSLWFNLSFLVTLGEEGVLSNLLTAETNTAKNNAIQRWCNSSYCSTERRFGCRTNQF